MHELVAVLRRDGGARFVGAPVVRADQRDFPGRWTPTVAGAGALLRLLFWHAHLDAEVATEDARTGRPGMRNGMRDTSVELVAAADARATFRVDVVGNDDVAGLLCLQVGRAYVALVGRDPFRGDTGLTDDRTDAVAAIAIGLGVLVANAWRHDKAAIAHRRFGGGFGLIHFRRRNRSTRAASQRRDSDPLGFGSGWICGRV